MKFFATLIAAFVLAALFCVNANAGQPVRVELKTGEHVAGHVDSRTTSRTLWLRATRGTVRVLRPIPRRQIETLKIYDSEAAFRSAIANGSQADRAYQLLIEGNSSS